MIREEKMLPTVVTFVDSFFKRRQYIPFFDQIDRIDLLFKEFGKMLLVNIIQLQLSYSLIFSML